MSGLRKGALCLHSLQAADRAWLLKKLPQPDRKQLNILLAELKVLGIPCDQALQDLGMQIDPKNTLLDVNSNDEYELNSTKAKVIWSVLEDEMPSVVAAVLGCHHWSWGSTVTAWFEKKHHCSLRLPEAINSRVRQALLASLIVRVRNVESSQFLVKPNSDGFFKRLGGFLWLQ